ncbi:Negative cofactor 2 complex subunit beta [Neolecta irregularis DAH-3]|uniref:Negative cofactor 2 complex subunit beta n=1 Tax=Neolecta irregularis (strain DAH-3) TaxID=1198029 RepID=A0A1U7LID0_NEOID|nr:Negative cofactor 2 complex subunit beta [Neolecta irregularis DAH-3]|eukprot:OLL22399.1 Negative cofactor 2 complex subunit beta [Neolecta irregularis DAH-3]
MAGVRVDDEVIVATRKPRARLDDARLLSDAGLPKLRRHAATRLRLHRHGHEHADLGRLLQFYQLWMHELFPKSTFRDTIKMVEKAGRSKTLRLARQRYLDDLRHPPADPTGSDASDVPMQVQQVSRDMENTGPDEIIDDDLPIENSLPSCPFVTEHDGQSDLDDWEALRDAESTVQKLIAEILPVDLTFNKETRDLLIDCCVEFVHLISSEANEICERESKKTIAAEHVIKALEDLGFNDYIADIKEVAAEHKEQQKSKEKKQSKLDQSGMSEAELLRQQEELFGKARERYELQHQ